MTWPADVVRRIERRGHAYGDLGTVHFPNGTTACTTDAALMVVLVHASRDAYLKLREAKAS